MVYGRSELAPGTAHEAAGHGTGVVAATTGTRITDADQYQIDVFFDLCVRLQHTFSLRRVVESNSHRVTDRGATWTSACASWDSGLVAPESESQSRGFVCFFFLFDVAVRQVQRPHTMG